jgi:hypothetical protein
VAGFALNRQSGQGVVGGLRGGKGGGMTGIALCGNPAVTAGVAKSTVFPGMRTRKREFTQGMIKGNFGPYIAAVAQLALRRIGPGFVFFGVVKLGLMTANALRLRVDHRSFMAIGALLNTGMPADQFETGGYVIEC